MRWKSNKLAGASAAALAGLGLALAAPAIQAGVIAVSPRSAGPLQAIGGSAAAKERIAPRMKRYKNARWNFALDVPAAWNAFPPGPPLGPDDVSSPYEVVRFSEKGDGTLLGVYRRPSDPSSGPALAVRQAQATLANDGFSNFVAGVARMGPRRMLTLDCEKPRAGGQPWRIRAYFIVDGTLTYILGFGASDAAEAPGLYDRIAGSFTAGEAGRG